MVSNITRKKRTFVDDAKVIEASTLGPWMFDCGGHLFEGCIPENCEPKEGERGFIIGEVWNEADQRFIAWARERWPVALQCIKELEKGRRQWYHGTSKEIADKILVEGFNKRTYFTPDLDSALYMGGPYVFSVYFEESPTTHWQWLSSFPILPDKIISLRRFDIGLLYFNPAKQRELHHTGLLNWFKEMGRDMQICSICDGRGELGLVRDGKHLSLCSSSERVARSDDCIPCPDCKGHGAVEKEG